MSLPILFPIHNRSIVSELDSVFTWSSDEICDIQGIQTRRDASLGMWWSWSCLYPMLAKICSIRQQPYRTYVEIFEQCISLKLQKNR